MFPNVSWILDARLEPGSAESGPSLGDIQITSILRSTSKGMEAGGAVQGGAQAAEKVGFKAKRTSSVHLP